MSGHRRPFDDVTYTRRRLLVVTAAVVVPAVAFSQLRGKDARSEASQPSLPATTGPASTEPPSTVASTGVPLSSVPTVEFDHDVGPGMNGAKVTALQDRLRQLGFDPGPSDATFGPATERAVWAFEKLILDTASDEVAGVVTPAVWLQMNGPISIRPRRSGPGVHLEILLPQQVGVLYADDEARLITHISSGSGDEWCDVVTVDNDDGTQSEEGICGIAVTPGGVFHFERRFDGWRNSKLGRLYNPVYFNYGIAVHGSSNVPSSPVSHGCVRIPMHVAEYFPSLVKDGDLVYVFDGIEEPETYGAQLPVFDYADPSFTTTTSSTSTTVQPATTNPPGPVSPSTQPKSTTPQTTHEHPPTATITPTTSTPSVTVPETSTTVVG